MNRHIFLLLAASVAHLHGANVWDGGAGDGLWSSLANWDDDVLPTSSPTFPASAPNKQVNLGGTRTFQRVVMQGGYRLHSGRLAVFGGGTGAEIESTGDNMLDATYGTESFGNSVKLIQNAGGTLTVNGATSGFQKGVTLNAMGTIVATSTIAPASGSSFTKTGAGLARLTASASVQGAGSGRFVSQGTLILNGTANSAAAWTVDGGRLGGTGTLNSAVTAGATLGSVIAPGDPASADGIGTLTVAGSVTLGENATLEVQLGAPGTGDRLALTGALSIAAHTGLWVRAAAGATPAGSYTIVTHGGARTGTFVLLDAPAGTTVDYSVPGEVRVVVTAPAATENITFPAASGVLDVTQPPYNAIPNDGIDDTAAIQAALNAYPNGRRIVYLPNGTYDISDTLSWPAGVPGATDYKRTVMQGQSRDGVILRLKNNATGFQDPANRRAVIYTGPAPAQRFGNSVRTLTVHTGSGNPGASGVQFNANNWGSIRRVKIISGDGQGVTGLDLHFTSEIGPLLVQDVEVEGFDHGIRTDDAINGIVLERITVRGQNVAGVRNSGQVFSVRDFLSVNSVPAFTNGTSPFGGVDTGGACSLLDARFVGLPGAENVAAITSAAFLHARNVITTGYLRVLSRPLTSGTATVNGASLDEYRTNSISSLFTSPARGLGLPVEDPPDVPWDAPADWANVADFGAVGSGGTDNTAAFQAAVDSGKPTVFVPPGGTYQINGDVLIRGNVRRFLGTHANVSGGGRLVVVDAAPPVVRIERANFPGIAVQTSRTVVVSAVACGSVVATGTGKLFIDDVVGDRFQFLNPRAHIWARQLNVENDSETNIVNDGATLWILGLKTERGQTKVETKNGGFTELLGMHNYSTTNPGTAPLFTITDAAASFATVAESNFNGTPYAQYVRETRGGVMNTLASSTLPARTSANGKVMTLYTGFDGAPKRPLDCSAAPLSPTSIALTWSDQSWDETSFQIERSADGTSWSTLATAAAGATIHTDSSVAPGSTFQYRVRAVNGTAASAPTAAASATTPTLFQSWLVSFGLPANVNPLADDDHDGVPLFAEYALGGTPLTGDTALLPTVSRTANLLTLTYSRARAELTYLVETSPDLSPGSWSTAGVNQGTPGPTVTASYALSGEPRRFIRLRIVGP